MKKFVLLTAILVTSSCGMNPINSAKADSSNDTSKDKKATKNADGLVELPAACLNEFVEVKGVVSSEKPDPQSSDYDVLVDAVKTSKEIYAKYSNAIEHSDVKYYYVSKENDSYTEYAFVQYCDGTKPSQSKICGSFYFKSFSGRTSLVAAEVWSKKENSKTYLNCKE